jgi:hypothetical protein
MAVASSTFTGYALGEETAASVENLDRMTPAGAVLADGAARLAGYARAV